MFHLTNSDLNVTNGNDALQDACEIGVDRIEEEEEDFVWLLRKAAYAVTARAFRVQIQRLSGNVEESIEKIIPRDSPPNALAVAELAGEWVMSQGTIASDTLDQWIGYQLLPHFALHPCMSELHTQMDDLLRSCATTLMEEQLSAVVALAHYIDDPNLILEGRQADAAVDAIMFAAKFDREREAHLCIGSGYR